MEIKRTTDSDTTTWAATIDGTEVAWLSVWTANGEICSVDTLSAHRRRGHAAALYRHADTDFTGGIFHTIPAHRSPEGDAFAASVSGDEITDALVIEYCCCDHCSA